MNYENILITKENHIATITINRPTKLNALNKVTIKELHDATGEKLRNPCYYFNR